MYLLDTNILSELVKRKPNRNLMRKLAAVPAALLCTASVCVMELRYGALRRGDGGVLWMEIQERIISQLSVLVFGLEQAVTAGEIFDFLHGKGTPIGIEDLLIGAIALSNGLVVVTGNTKHLLRIPNLRVENWLLPGRRAHRRWGCRVDAAVSEVIRDLSLVHGVKLSETLVEAERDSLVRFIDPGHCGPAS